MHGLHSCFIYQALLYFRRMFTLDPSVIHRWGYLPLLRLLRRLQFLSEYLGREERHGSALLVLLTLLGCLISLDTLSKREVKLLGYIVNIPLRHR